MIKLVFDINGVLINCGMSNVISGVKDREVMFLIPKRDNNAVIKTYLKSRICNDDGYEIKNLWKVNEMINGIIYETYICYIKNKVVEQFRFIDFIVKISDGCLIHCMQPTTINFK